MTRIILTGPESSGKTTLALVLAAHYGVPWVPEYARTYLQKKGLRYIENDLFEMAKGQVFLEKRISAGDIPLLICDTDLLTIKIWSDYKYGQTHPWILEQLQKKQADHYFLCNIDVPWESDPQRENPMDREELYDIYKKELLALNVPFTEISGDLATRLQTVKKQIDELL